MQTPSFFADAPSIDMIDPLADLLGAVVDGRITYTYADTVKLAGHSCPTVAGAYLMTKMSLDHLYEGETPVRGTIKVEMRDAETNEVTGVIGNVIGLITGAAGAGGFKGIGGRFKRCGLLEYGADQTRSVRFTRLDTGRSIEADFDATVVPPDPAQGPMMQALMSGVATADDMKKFGDVWQQRVGTMMTSPELWPRMVRLG